MYSDNIVNFVNGIAGFEDDMQNEMMEIIRDKFEGKESVQIVKETVMVRLPGSKATFKELIGKQSALGFWTGDGDCKEILQSFMDGENYLHFSGVDKLTAQLKAISGISDDDFEKILATLVALYILYENFEDHEGEWKLIERKSKEWLKAVGVTRIDDQISAICFKVK